LIGQRLALAWLAMLASHASAVGQWVDLPAADARQSFSIDLDSIDRRGSNVRFQERMLYLAPTVRDPASGRIVKEKWVRRVMDCAAKTQGTLSGATYSDDDRLIEYLAVNPGQVAMTPIPPGSVAEQEWEQVCGTAGTKNATKPLPPSR
jgi:hypothetical protein